MLTVLMLYLGILSCGLSPVLAAAKLDGMSCFVAAVYLMSSSFHV